ncbi:MAG: TrbC/VirB2 family protein [Rhodomicrobium sp.]|jgi:type IV secretion system protein VirB2
MPRILALAAALACLLALFALSAEPALATTTTTTTGGLPWESPLNTIRDSLKGPVALAISLIGIVVTGAMLIFGGEINEFARRVIMMVLVVALLVQANNVLTTLFTTGAVL